MFVCELCGSQVAPRIPAHRIVLAWRARRYPLRDLPARSSRSSPHATRDRGGVGYEITREALACPDCARRHTVPAPPTLDSDAPDDAPPAEPLKQGAYARARYNGTASRMQPMRKEKVGWQA